MDNAERHHEVRYDTPNERGIIDLLYGTSAGRFIIDFKTDDVRSDAEAQSVIRQHGYDQQVARYAQAVAEKLSVVTKTRLVFKMALQYLIYRRTHANPKNDLSAQSKPR